MATIACRGEHGAPGNARVKQPTAIYPAKTEDPSENSDASERGKEPEDLTQKPVPFVGRPLLLLHSLRSAAADERGLSVDEMGPSRCLARSCEECARSRELGGRRGDLRSGVILASRETDRLMSGVKAASGERPGDVRIALTSNDDPPMEYRVLLDGTN